MDSASCRAPCSPPAGTAGTCPRPRASPGPGRPADAALRPASIPAVPRSRSTGCKFRATQTTSPCACSRFLFGPAVPRPPRGNRARCHNRLRKENTMRPILLLLAMLLPALAHSADAPRRVPLKLRPEDVLATGNEWLALPDIRASDGALGTFNALSM